MITVKENQNRKTFEISTTSSNGLSFSFTVVASSHGEGMKILHNALKEFILELADEVEQEKEEADND